MRIPKFVPLLLIVQLALWPSLCEQLAWADSTSSTGKDIDLSSTQTAVSAGQMNGFTPINISSGGNQQAVTASSMLTPAENVALYQVLHGGQQLLVIGAQGNAVGG